MGIIHGQRLSISLYSTPLQNSKKFSSIEHFLLPTDAYNVKKRSY